VLRQVCLVSIFPHNRISLSFAMCSLTIILTQVCICTGMPMDVDVDTEVCYPEINSYCVHCVEYLLHSLPRHLKSANKNLKKNDQAV
jgi:hypothetical protein